MQLTQSLLLLLLLCGWTALQPSEPYANKYKGISICLHIFSSALVGGYVQFGVFELYKDPALVRALACHTHTSFAKC